jgi:hypothetical protein
MRGEKMQGTGGLVAAAETVEERSGGYSGGALACQWRPLESAHLTLLAVAAWLIGLGWSPSWQSDGIHPDAAFPS